MLFIGHTRFSVYNYQSNQFGALKDGSIPGEVEYRNFLYDEIRLRDKVNFFRNVSLPQIALSAGRVAEIRHIVTFSDSLPLSAKSELRTAAEDHPWLILNEIKHGEGAPVGPPAAILRQIASDLNHINRPIGVYRLDDDDALSSHFFSHVSRFITPGNIGFKVSLGLGLSGYRANDGRFYFNRQVHKPMLGIGLMAIGQVSADGEIKGTEFRRHRFSDRWDPVVLDSTFPAFYWTRDMHQITSVSKGQGVKRSLLSKVVSELSQWPPALIDQSEIIEGFPHLVGHLRGDIGPGEELSPDFSPSTQAVPVGADVLIDDSSHILLEVEFHDDSHSQGAVCLKFDLFEEGRPVKSGRQIKKEVAARGVRWSSEVGCHVLPFKPTHKNRRILILDLPGGVYAKNLEVVNLKGASLIGVNGRVVSSDMFG